jgi:hypothetical protein
VPLIVVVLSTACAQQSSQSLQAALQGIDKASFLACSGPPLFESPQGPQDRMSFVTNLARGEAIGIGLDKALTPASCSVDALFVDNRLASANFSGNLTMCDRVFSACRK